MRTCSCSSARYGFPLVLGSGARSCLDLRAPRAADALCRLFGLDADGVEAALTGVEALMAPAAAGPGGRMKPRPPTLRQNRRYVLVRIAPVSLVPDGKALYLAIAEAVSALYGDDGAAVIDQAVVAVERGHAIVRCRRGRRSG